MGQSTDQKRKMWETYYRDWGISWECYTTHLPRPGVDSMMDIVSDAVHHARPSDIPMILRDLADWYHDGHAEDRNYAPAASLELTYDSPPVKELAPNHDVHNCPYCRPNDYRA